MKTNQIRWKPTIPQDSILQSQSKFRTFLGGIGSGKTAVGWMCAVSEAISQPGSVGVIVTTTYPMLRDVIWREMDVWVPDGLIKKFDQTNKELELVNGSIILFRSADNPRQIDRLRGMSIAWFWADEITLMPKLVWDVLIGRLRQPAMKHRGLLTGTPKLNWVYDLFIDEKSAITSDDYFVLKEIPTFSNIHLPDGYLQTLKEQYTGQFYEQEVLGKFVSFEGLIYETHSNTIIESHGSSYSRVTYGVDFGFKNPSAVVVLGMIGEKYYAIDEFYQRKVTDDELIDILKTKMDIWGAGDVYCDPSAPASIEKMTREGISAIKANNDVLGGIRQVRSLLDSGMLHVCDNCQNLINEFNMYAWDDKVRKEQPIKLNDHACDALRYCTLGILNYKPAPNYRGQTVAAGHNANVGYGGSRGGGSSGNYI